MIRYVAAYYIIFNNHWKANSNNYTITCRNSCNGNLLETGRDHQLTVKQSICSSEFRMFSIRSVIETRLLMPPTSATSTKKHRRLILSILLATYQYNTHIVLYSPASAWNFGRCNNYHQHDKKSNLHRKTNLDARIINILKAN